MKLSPPQISASGRKRCRDAGGVADREGASLPSRPVRLMEGFGAGAGGLLRRRQQRLL